MSGVHSPTPVGANSDPNRDSRFESAQEANDIFALYGRDSWALSDTASVQEPRAAATDVGSPRLGPRAANGDQMEQLDSDDEPVDASPTRPSFETAHSRPDFSQPRPGLDVPDSPRTGGFYAGEDVVHAQPYHPAGGWGGAVGREPEHIDRHMPMNPSGLHESQVYQRPTSENAPSGPPESLNSHYSSSMGPHEPELYYSPPSGEQAHSDQYHDAHSGEHHSHGQHDTTSYTQPTQPATSSHVVPPSQPPHPRTPERLSPPSASPPGSGPVHPSIARLNGRVPIRNGPPTSPSSAGPSSAGDHSMSLSQASLVSSQYPGEDDESFHVRSTCKLTMAVPN